MRCQGIRSDERGQSVHHCAVSLFQYLAFMGEAVVATRRLLCERATSHERRSMGEEQSFAMAWNMTHSAMYRSKVATRHS